MAILVVIAHSDKNSFTQQWAKESIHEAKNLEHEVLVSDLYEMKFDPIEKAAHYNFTYPKTILTCLEHKSSIHRIIACRKKS